MSRPIINTVFTPRVQPTTVYSKPRDVILFTADTTLFTADTTLFTADVTERSGVITTSYTTPRKGTLLQDLSLDFVTDLLGADVDGLTGNDGNLIVTKWT